MVRITLLLPSFVKPMAGQNSPACARPNRRSSLSEDDVLIYKATPASQVCYYYRLHESTYSASPTDARRRTLRRGTYRTLFRHLRSDDRSLLSRRDVWDRSPRQKVTGPL